MNILLMGHGLLSVARQEVRAFLCLSSSKPTVSVYMYRHVVVVSL